MTEATDKKSGNGRESAERPSRFRRAADAIGSVFSNLWASRWVALAAVVVLLVLLIPETLRQQLSRAQHAVFPWTMPDEPAGGLIRVTAPRVFTRERLVNDRFEEAAWLQDRLFETNRLLAENSFGRPDQIRVEWTTTGEDGDRAASSGTTAEGDGEPGVLGQLLSGGEPWRLSQEQQLERAIGYRDRIRRRLMSENLDDTHDLDGNTLYRMDLAASITPPPYSDAVAIIEVTVEEGGSRNSRPNGSDDADAGAAPQPLSQELLLAYSELLEEWREETERSANRLLRDRLQILRSGHSLSAEESSAFADYRRQEIENIFGGESESNRLSSYESLIAFNRVAYLSVFHEFIISDLEDLLKFNRQEYRGLEIARYRSICQENGERLDQEALEKFVGAPVPRAIKHLCIKAPDNWQTMADFELLYGLRLIEEVVGAESFKSCFRDFSLDFADRFRVIDLDPDSQRGIRFGPQKWPSITILYEHAKQYSCNFAISEEIINNLLGFATWDRLSSEVARFIWFLVNNKTSKNLTHLKLNEYFSFDIAQCGILDCKLNVETKDVHEASADSASNLPAIADQESQEKNNTKKDDLIDKLYKRLNNGARALAYSVIPDQELVYADELSAQGLVLRVDNLGRPIVVRNESATRGVNATGGIVGFGDWGDKRDSPSQSGATPGSVSEQSDTAGWHGAKTKFGWFVFAGASNIREGGPSPRHVPLSALVSLPSWWRKIDVTITTCWLSRARLGSAVTLQRLCADRAGVEQTMPLNLPGTAIDVSRRLMFEVVKYPFVNAPENRLEVEMGRHASLAISGGRLWKSPRVQLGHQWADRVQVLPDMNGIIADFKCVEPQRGFVFPPASGNGPRVSGNGKANNGGAQRDGGPAGNGAATPDRDSADHSATSTESDENERPARLQQTPGAERDDPGVLRIWTSEGVTQPLPVYYRHFHKRYGVPTDTPCLGRPPAGLDQEPPVGRPDVAAASEPPRSNAENGTATASD